ncbi:ricin B-like lectin R40G3 [Aristolochia californica]|uniref:ricin B-like lectin R40G3 n=1 Tax=Aristolochia californica TaxID=171875 RepID=UPI0035DA17A8
MEFPFGRPFEHHHRREEEPPVFPPPPPFHIHHETHDPHRPGSNVYRVHHDTRNALHDDSNARHIHHEVRVPHRHDQYYPPPGTRSFSPPPPPSRHIHYEHSGLYMPPPPFSSNVQHVAHETHGPFPSHNHPWPDHRVVLPRGENVRVFCEAETDYSLTIRDGSVVLARRNPHDEFQHWIKDETYSTKVKDQEGFPSFALVNKATGQALQHAIGATQPVRLKPYCPDEFDESILWTKSKDLGHGFRAIRMVNNILLNLDAFNGDKNHGGVHDGTVAVLWEWKKGDNQRWKLVPY